MSDHHFRKPKQLLTYHFDSGLQHVAGAFFEEYLALAEKHLGPALAQIDGYVCAHGSRAERVFTSAPRALYISEFTAILTHNLINWKRFVEAEKVVIIVPDCLALMGEKCDRKGRRMTRRCRRCVPNCRIGQIAALQERYGFELHFAYRPEKRQFRRMQRKFGEVALIGIACLLMLADGLRQAREMGIPAQGVPLLYCGCELWTPAPFTTETDLAFLEDLLARRAAERRSPGESVTAQDRG